MNEDKTTAIVSMKPVFMCSFATGEVSFLDARELIECAETGKLPIDRITGKPLENYSFVEARPFRDPDMKVVITDSAECLFDKLQELTKAIKIALI